MAGSPTGEPATAADSVVTYIIRRLIGAVLMLFVVSVVTFSIFFVVPRLAGSSPETLAARYVGKTANQAAVEAATAAPRLQRPDPGAVRPVGQGDRGRGRLRLRAGGRALPGALLRLLLHHPAAGLERPDGPAAGDARRWPSAPSLIWLLGGVAIGVRLRGQTRERLRPGRHGRRAGRRLPTHLLHRAHQSGDLQLSAELDRARGELHPDHRESRLSGRTT